MRNTTSGSFVPDKSNFSNEKTNEKIRHSSPDVSSEQNDGPSSTLRKKSKGKGDKKDKKRNSPSKNE